MPKPDEKAVKLLKRFEEMKRIRSNYEGMWEEVMWHIAPFEFSFQKEKRDRPFRIPKRITNRPSKHLNTLTSGICGYAVSPNIKWFKLGLLDDTISNQIGVRQWLENVEKIIRRTFERCAFYTKVPIWVEQAAIFGHAALLIEELWNDDNPLKYTVPEIYEIYLNSSFNGVVQEVARVYEVNLETLVEMYGSKALSQDMQLKWDQYTKIESRIELAPNYEILHLVMKRREGEANFGDLKQNKKWASYIIDLAGSHIIEESGYDEFPYCIFFWEQRGKVYGISPAIKAINDIALLQETEKTRLEVAEQSANPAKIVPEGMKGKEQFQPGGYNYVRDKDNVPQQMNVGANYPINIEITNALNDQVKEQFAVDTFTALRQAGGIQHATATAVAAMQGEQTALLTPMVTNLYMALSHAVTRTFNILAKKRTLPPMPYALERMGGSLKIDFLGVLAQAQKAAYEFGGIMDVIGIASQFAQFGQVDPTFTKALNWLNPEVLFKKVIESRSAPADIMRTEDEFEEIVAEQEAQQQQMMQQAAQAQQQQALMQNAGKLNEPINPDSPLANFTSALGGLGGRPRQ